jgi:tetratricopeptide (TPR) repeat protein
MSVEPQRVAVLRFENQTADPELDPLGAAFALALAEQIAGLDRVAAFPVGSPGEAAGRQAALLVHGRIVEEKGGYRLSASLERLDKREFEAAGSFAGPRDRLPALLESIAGGIQSAVRPKGKLDPPAVTTVAAAVALGKSLESLSAESISAELQRAVESDPACGVCWRRLVEINLAAGNRDAALAFAESSRRGPISPYNRALIDLTVAAAGNDLQRQLRALERLAQLRPGEYETQARRGSVLASLGRWPEAAESYRAAVAASPRSPGLWNEFGYVLAWAGNSSEARRALDEYARLDPSSPNPLDSQGEVALLAGRFEEAIVRFEECYRRDKTFNGGQAIEKAAWAAYLAGEKARAASYVDRFLSTLGDPGQPRVRVVRARWQHAFGDISSAIQSMEPVDPALAALLPAAAGDMENARARIQAIKTPNGARIRNLLQAGTGWPEDSRSRTDLAVFRGMNEALNRRWTDAAITFQRALAAVPANSPQAALLREAAAWTLVMDSKPVEASKLLGALWPLPMPGGFAELSLLVYPNLFYTRAEIALAQGRRDDARKLYDLFLQYAGDRKDPLGTLARARAAARL